MSRRKWLVLGFGLVVGVVGLGMIVWTPAGMVANLVGFRQTGKTEDFLAANSRLNPRPSLQWPEPEILPITPLPTAINEESVNGEPADALSSTSGGIVSQTTPDPAQPLASVKVAIYFLPEPRLFYADEIFASRLERRQGEGKPVTYLIEFDEAGLNQYLNYWFGFWAESDSQISDIYFDLKPTGLIVYGNVDLWLGSQRVGIVFTLDSSGRQFVFQGVDIEGKFFAQPPAGPVADYVHQLERQGNLALADLRFLDPAGTLTIQQIYLDEDRVQIIAQ